MIPAPAPRVSGSLVRKSRVHGDQWFAKYRVGGRQYKRRIGPVWTDKGRPPDGYFTRRTANEVLQAILTDARRTGVPSQARGRRGHTFGQACKDWLRYIEFDRGRAPSTIADYTRSVDNHFLPEFGADTPIAQITTDQIDRWIGRLLAEGRIGRPSIRKLRTLLHGVFKLAKRRKHIIANPVEDAEPVDVPRSGEFNVLTIEEVGAVIRHALSEQDAVIYTVAAFAGLRMGEIRALRWRHIDFANQTIHVMRNFTHGGEKLPKSGKVRSVPLIDRVAAALDDLSRRGELTEPEDLVFVSPTARFLYEGDVRRRFYTALENAGLGHKRLEAKPITFHDLRHTFGTLAVGVWDLPRVKAYMGHADISTTMGYVHHVPKTDDANTLSALVEQALSAVAQLA